MPDFNVHAIVLRRSHYGETDNILTLYTRERGKISAIAKGARKPISRLSGATELLSHSRLSLASGRTLQIVRQAEVVESLPALREDLVRLANGLYVAELLSGFVTDSDPNPDLFDLFSDSLRYISSCISPGRAARWFELQLLDIVGFAPLLTECTYCGTNLSPAPLGSLALSASQGGALCPRHSRSETFDDHSPLDQKSLALMQTLGRGVFAGEQGLLDILNSSHQSDGLASASLRRYMRFRLDRDLKSIAFLDTVQETK